jgi:tetratricopeptide (TPR) repeat protein
MLRITVAALLAFSAVAAQAQGDKNDQEPKRPQLVAGADTNDASVYYAFGLDRLEKDPKIAADAFYWASRLNPVYADAFYARRVALLLTDRRRLVRYWDEDKGTLRSPEIKRIDSLYYFALTLNPFLYEKLDRLLFGAIIDDFVHRQSLGVGAPSPADLRFQVDQWLMRAGPGMKAWRAYGEARFDDALRLYADAVKNARYKYGYRSMRGRIFFQLNQPDSALSELSKAVEEVRKRDIKDLVYVYESKALYEHAVGMSYERLNNMPAAREAYARALQEDLAYSPAHIRLAYMAFESKDTATAVSEFDLAVQLREDDSGLRYQYGYVLAETRRDADAEVQLKKALELNPTYALPHHILGRLYERQGKTAEAVQSYRAFLAMASRRDVRRAEVEQKIQVLAAK